MAAIAVHELVLRARSGQSPTVKTDVRCLTLLALRAFLRKAWWSHSLGACLAESRRSSQSFEASTDICIKVFDPTSVRQTGYSVSKYWPEKGL